MLYWIYMEWDYWRLYRYWKFSWNNPYIKAIEYMLNHLYLITFVHDYIHKACPDGFFGENCATMCPEAYFGPACGYECNCTTDKCHHITGCSQFSLPGKALQNCFMKFQIYFHLYNTIRLDVCKFKWQHSYKLIKTMCLLVIRNTNKKLIFYCVCSMKYQ